MRRVIVGWSRIVLVLIVAAAFAVASGASSSLAAEGNPAATAKKAAPAKKPASAKKAPAQTTVKEMVEGEDVRDFRAFCDSWMLKLGERNIYNVANIKWDTRDGHVVGEYVNYGTDRTCTAREEPGKDPIGKITYREVLYRRQGATTASALAAPGPGTIIEQTDVTEIFRYGKGRWQY